MILKLKFDTKTERMGFGFSISGSDNANTEPVLNPSLFASKSGNITLTMSGIAKETFDAFATGQYDVVITPSAPQVNNS